MMYHTGETEHLNRGQCNLPATEEQQRALLSLSWYSSVPRAGAHLTLSRVSVPRSGGGPSFLTRVWIASRRLSADPRTVWRDADGNSSVINITRAEI